jgi:hypothetical protein
VRIPDFWDFLGRRVLKSDAPWAVVVDAGFGKVNVYTHDGTTSIIESSSTLNHQGTWWKK